ncbi:MAG: 6-phosphogluconolactonase [Thermoguttaceae bacterium]
MDNQINKPMEPLRKTVDRLKFDIYSTRQEAGNAAGTLAGQYILDVLTRQHEVRVVFAAAPSQNETLETLAVFPGIEWKRVTAFHMDEYIGLPPGAPERFASYLKARIASRVPFKQFHWMDDSDPDRCCDDYAALLSAAPIDLVLCGIGENGHIAFNDPPVADFADTKQVKIVELDELCRTQQVNDGCFQNLSNVPKTAMTLTIPALFAGKRLIGTVLGERKNPAINRLVHGDISTDSPATILRQHSDCTLFLDELAWNSHAQISTNLG